MILSVIPWDACLCVVQAAHLSLLQVSVYNQPQSVGYVLAIHFVLSVVTVPRFESPLSFILRDVSSWCRTTVQPPCSDLHGRRFEVLAFHWHHLVHQALVADGRLVGLQGAGIVRKPVPLKSSSQLLHHGGVLFLDTLWLTDHQAHSGIEDKLVPQPV